MTIVAHMPDAAAADGVTDDTTALQAMFDACPVGGLCLIPDGVFRVTTTVQVPRPMNVWCSPGAHIKGDFAGTQPVVHAYWHTPDGTTGLYVQQESAYWQGGTISRLSRNGPCLQTSAWRTGTVQNLRTERGSPHIYVAAPDAVNGWYMGGAGPNWTAAVRVVGCRGYDGGPYGIQVGQLPFYDSSGQANGHTIECCYFQGDGSGGSRGLQYFNGGGGAFFLNVFENYDVGCWFDVGTGSSQYGAASIGNKMISVTQDYEGAPGHFNNTVYIAPRGWESGRGTMTASAIDSGGVYL